MGGSISRRVGTLALSHSTHQRPRCHGFPEPSIHRNKMSDGLDKGISPYYGVGVHIYSTGITCPARWFMIGYLSSIWVPNFLCSTMGLASRTVDPIISGQTSCQFDFLSATNAPAVLLPCQQRTAPASLPLQDRATSQRCMAPLGPHNLRQGSRSYRL